MLAGNVALENAGFRTFGFGAGREDVWEPDLDVDWGDEKEWLAHRHPESLAKQAIGATEMGLIYVNPEGPNASGEPPSAAAAIRATFGNMAMDDEEIVALIAGGHTLGKPTAPPKPATSAPSRKPPHWKRKVWAGTPATAAAQVRMPSPPVWKWSGRRRPPSGATTSSRTCLNMNGCRPAAPAGAIQFEAKDAPEIILDPFNPGKNANRPCWSPTRPCASTRSLKRSPRRFLNDPQAFNEAFARAWFKLTHRDMGPKSRYLGPES